VNSLIILPNECINEHVALLTGERARYAYDTHGVRVGQKIKVGILGGLRGEGLVVEASLESVRFEVRVTEPPLAPAKLDLIVGVPRPQTVKKVIQAAVMFGVSSLHFVRSERGDKSYLQSRALDPDQVLDETVKALEQVWDTRPPEIVVHRNFSYFMDHKLRLIESAAGAHLSKLIAHPTHQQLTVSDVLTDLDTHTLVAIGPERGWSDAEVDLFTQSGFTPIGLGERVVRVELALVFLLGKLSLLRPD
jgi:RsmE family RNA methyltransferase